MGIYVINDEKCVNDDLICNNVLIAHIERRRLKIDMSITFFEDGKVICTIRVS